MPCSRNGIKKRFPRHRVGCHSEPLLAAVAEIFRPPRAAAGSSTPMACESRSPESETRERAVSTEPSGIRPNPFQEDDESSRKRRRTSMTGNSRSRSVETLRSSNDGDSGSDPSPSTTTISRAASTTTLDETAVNANNRTADSNTAGGPPRTPDRGTASHVTTLRLRNSANRTLDTIPSSPDSPQSPTPALPTRSHGGDGDDVHTSIEPTDLDGMPPPPAATPGEAGIADSPPTSRSETTSPPVEVVDVLPDDDAGLEGRRPVVTLLDEDPEDEPGLLTDPTTQFPYQTGVETPAEIVTKLIGYLTTDIHVPRHLKDWIDRYLQFAQNVPFQTAFLSYQQYRNLWIALPDLIWGVPNLRTPNLGVADRNMREKLLDFCGAFARLTAYFVELDYKTLQQLIATNDLQPREFISTQYLMALSSITRRDPAQRDEDRVGLRLGERDEIAEIVDQFLLFHRVPPCCTLLLLDRLLEAQIALIPTVPRIIENFGQICVMASFVVREASRKLLASPGLRPPVISGLNSRLAMGHRMFKAATVALSTVIEHHITSLSYENASQQINALGEMIRLSLKADSPEAAQVVAAFQDKHPDTPPECVSDVYAMEWRFGMYCRLIMCSQMQLRVMAVTNLCQDLVACWRRYGEHLAADGVQLADGVREIPVLRHVSDLLATTGVVVYLLGPTCHPEITAEGSNVIGFLAVTRTYTNAHTDLFWQTVTTTQDPRISEALLRMTCRIANLFSYDAAVYICQKLLKLPVTAFTPTMREFCDSIFRHVSNKMALEHPPQDTVPFAVCLRLLREASVPGVKTPTAYPDVQAFAIEKLSELLKNVGIEHDQRQSLYQSCLSDIRDKSPTTLGSLCAINIINRHYGGRDLAGLTVDNNLTELVVEELENAIREGKRSGFPAVISGATNAPRRDMIFQIVVNHPSTLMPALASRLWNLMTGPDAACREDRNASWRVLNACAKRCRYEQNPFLSMCFDDLLSHLPPDCFCEGLLDFIRDTLIPLVNDVESILLDDEDGNAGQCILEQLWRVILTAPPNTVERSAISLLVKDVYIESRSIVSFPHHRARKVHLALVDRCLKQLSSAAKKLRSDNNEGSSSGDDDSSLVVILSRSQIHEQETLFIRSLSVLKEFHRLYCTRAQFSAPDLRTFMSKSCDTIEGESAELKYQSFDGHSQTDVKPLNIGRQNTAGSLLASLKDATGFDNYRIYYRGQAFVPKEGDICRSLEELHIHNGLILVKREVHAQVLSPNVRPGTSAVDSEILGHFKELWEYLSMEEKLAKEIHLFLVRLPVEDSFLRIFEDDSVFYKDVFSVGQPYKSLYALYSLRAYLVSRQPLAAAKSAASLVDTLPTQEQEQEPTKALEPVLDAAADENDTTAEQPYLRALATARRLIVAAICDPDVTQLSASPELQMSLCSTLIDLLVYILNNAVRVKPSAENLDAMLLNRLVEILSMAVDAPSTDPTVRLVQLCFHAIMESCVISRGFWTAFREHQAARQMVERLLLDDWRLSIRQMASKQIGDKVLVDRSDSAVPASEFREHFWPIVQALIPRAIKEPNKCEDIFNLAFNLFQQMRESKSPVLDMGFLLHQISSLLLSYTTIEDITQPESADYVAYGLVQMLLLILRSVPTLDLKEALPEDFANKLFWKHLFPPWQFKDEDEEEGLYSDQKPFPQVIVNPPTRASLIQIMFELVDDDTRQLPFLIRNLDQLVPCDKTDDDEPYHYDLPQQLDRTKAVRAPCGYVGLRNLSNTCYFNSLFTQLFMNIEFRRFMMNVDISDEADAQSLLFQTRVLFSFMQDSIRRFLDTSQCVASVKTYDDTTIDIHNQMDVDEFYNLLFDRWEGQMPNADAKRTFRDFYGGQLVQQVRSKECEHVSERLEPFSAIQCDIKGKSNLQESLQAYVDGEIMEGDNKYKCSTCDRHVDAVKRACLKDIPDHLIFHLKRFDFNLRTLQRSKINDYFSFPHKIDMRPYTIDQLSSPSEEIAEDVFELVGVLVHSGTAESGHYYSYIRERPSSKQGESWVEFNDDMVSAWDPTMLETSCFGGSDYRLNHFNGDGNSLVVDKSFSAYMLFYQRSSSLAKEQGALADAGRNSPVRVEMPPALSKHIRSENTSLVRRHCLYDPQQIPFVSKVLGCLQYINGGGRCSSTHKLEDLGIQMALSHLDQVASRTKDIPDFQTLLDRILSMGNRCAHCYMAVFEYFEERHDALRQMIQRSPEPVVRSETGSLLIQALQAIKKAMPEQYGAFVEPYSDSDDDTYERMDLGKGTTVLRSAGFMLQTLWDHFHVALRSWSEVFGFMLAFVRIGREELAVFLDMDGLRKALMVIAADSSASIEPQYMRMLNAVQRRLPNRPPSYDNVIGLIDAALAGMYPARSTPRTWDELFVDDSVSRYSLAARVGSSRSGGDASGDRQQQPDLPMSHTEYVLLTRDWVRDYGNIFVDKLIVINQNVAATHSIITRLMATYLAMEAKVFVTLKANISSNVAVHFQGPYLRTAVVFLRRAETAELSYQLMMHIAEQCRGLVNADGRAFFETLRELFHDRDLPPSLQGLEILPVWAPGLLAYYDTAVSTQVEIFLRVNLFHPSAQMDEEEEMSAERAAAVVTAVKRLGVECFKYIELYFVERSMQISTAVVATFQRVIAECRPYYALEGEGDELTEEFHRLDLTVPDLLQRLVVDDPEEDASDWNSSRCSSDPVDSLGDVSMQTGADLNDMDGP